MCAAVRNVYSHMYKPYIVSFISVPDHHAEQQNAKSSPGHHITKSAPNQCQPAQSEYIQHIHCTGK